MIPPFRTGRDIMEALSTVTPIKRPGADERDPWESVKWGIYFTQVAPRSCGCWRPEPGSHVRGPLPPSALGGVGRARTSAAAFCACVPSGGA